MLEEKGIKDPKQLAEELAQEDAEQVAKEMQRTISSVRGMGAPIGVTEFGFPVYSSEPKVPAVSLSEQGLLVREALSMLLKKRKHLNLERAVYYRIQDQPGSKWWYHTGLLTDTRDQRPAWGTFVAGVAAE